MASGILLYGFWDPVIWLLGSCYITMKHNKYILFPQGLLNSLVAGSTYGPLVRTWSLSAT